MIKKHMLKFLNQARIGRNGFTLMEMLVVIALIAIVGGFVASNVISKFQKAKVDAAKIQMRQIGVILDNYKMDCGMYPTEQQGLEALVSKPTSGKECKKYDPDGYVKDKRVPKDPWSNEFKYLSDGNQYELISLGNDSAEGGEGVKKDISTKDPEF